MSHEQGASNEVIGIIYRYDNFFLLLIFFLFRFSILKVSIFPSILETSKNIYKVQILHNVIKS